ncbi:hypothetical protein RHPLAN_36950 [Rhodoplanes sp. Z2-YC6860]|nr:hypothetical protein RHPLAN_36950 [Rhodoplanes sp. Z2-YC6860]
MALRTAAAALLLLCAVGAGWAQDGGRQALQTNEADIGGLRPAGSLATADIAAVFSYVLNALPERVNVLPTENYYYVRFVRDGVRYVGNIRLAAADRDQGKVNFSYSEEPTDWNSEPEERHEAFGSDKGVSVEKLSPLEYRVSRAGKSVTFALNDLSKVKPPAGLLAADEKFLGPVFDESGIRFFLVFNTRLKIFHFVLDETEPVADAFFPSKITTQIEIGKRTGFAFYVAGSRKILIGASERQSRLNTYLDGPFDQLPENFIAGDELRDAEIAAEPGVKGHIDRLGNFDNGEGRFLIHPYMLYRELADLAVFQRCVTSPRIKPGDRPLCFVIDDEEAQRKHPRPRALTRR